MHSGQSDCVMVSNGGLGVCGWGNPLLQSSQQEQQLSLFGLCDKTPQAGGSCTADICVRWFWSLKVQDQGAGEVPSVACHSLSWLWEGKEERGKRGREETVPFHTRSSGSAGTLHLPTPSPLDAPPFPYHEKNEKQNSI
jgi:hypothetical protein